MNGIHSSMSVRKIPSGLWTGLEIVGNAIMYTKRDWGDRNVSPRFLTTGAHGDTAATLSLWDDLESVYAFTYAGFHAEVLKKRDDWFVGGDYPAYVAWWIPDDATPTRAEGAVRLEHLHDNGPKPYAFDFKTPFDAEAQPLVMDRKKIQHHVEIVRSHMRHEPRD